jgi:hypothetical protein
MIEGDSWLLTKAEAGPFRTVYLYVATLVGLGLLIAGSVQAFELILKFHYPHPGGRRRAAVGEATPDALCH